MIPHRMRGQDRRRQDTVAMEMTPMIDVVFQLLIFFLFAVKQQDILAALAFVRPAAAPGGSAVELAVQVCNPAQDPERAEFRLKGRAVAFDRLDAHLARIAAHDPGVSVTVRCNADSSHSALVRLLDACAKSKLANVAVFSSREGASRGQE